VLNATISRWWQPQGLEVLFQVRGAAMVGARGRRTHDGRREGCSWCVAAAVADCSSELTVNGDGCRHVGG